MRFLLMLYAFEKEFVMHLPASLLLCVILGWLAGVCLSACVDKVPVAEDKTLRAAAQQQRTAHERCNRAATHCSIPRHIDQSTSNPPFVKNC